MGKKGKLEQKSLNLNLENKVRMRIIVSSEQ